jgi:hypothetical protein
VVQPAHAPRAAKASTARRILGHRTSDSAGPRRVVEARRSRFGSALCERAAPWSSFRVRSLRACGTLVLVSGSKARSSCRVTQGWPPSMCLS